MVRTGWWTTFRLVGRIAPLGGVFLACTAGTQASPCSADSLTLSGTLEGASVSLTYTGLSSYLFDDAAGGQPGSLLVDFGTGGKLSLTWTMPIANGASTAAYGTLVLPAGAPLAGQSFCISAATVTLLSTSQESLSFTLSTLVSGVCAGDSVAGTIHGCASPSK
jgi:hypothetical protein